MSRRVFPLLGLQHPGKCEIKFQSDSNVKAVNVNVKPDKP